MVSTKLLLCILAMTLGMGAASAGNMTTVMKAHSTSSSGSDTGDHEGAGHNTREVLSINSPPLGFGSWKVQSDMHDSISLHCYSQMTDLGRSILLSLDAVNQHFPIDPSYQELWHCDFMWSSQGASLEQSFEVWAHDGRTDYLLRCLDCQWKVEKDGFYFKDTNGKFYRKWEWSPGHAH